MMKSTTLKIALSSLFAVAILASPLLAQDEQVAEESSLELFQTNDGAPIIISSSSESLGEGTQSSMRIVASSSDGADMGGMFFADAMSGGMMGGDAFSMLSNASVQEDLELVGEQLEKVNKLRTDFSKEMQEQIQKVTSGDPSAAQGLGKRLKELQAEQKEKIESMLLPHQLERLKQVKLQMQMQNKGTGPTLNMIAEALGIDADQKKRIKERQKELNEELKERMAKLKEELQEKLLSELTSEQRQKLEELKGEKFEYKETDIGSMIRKRIESRNREDN